MFIGGDPEKGQTPVITATLQSPQVLVDSAKGTITILEEEKPLVIRQ